MRTSLILSLLLSLSSTFLLAQQNTADFISNDYIQSSNLLNTVSALSSYRNATNLLSPTEEEISNKSAYYKFSYQPSGTSSQISGLIDIRCLRNSGNQVTIEQNLNGYYTTLIADDDENDYVKEFLKNTLVHGGFFFSINRNYMYIIMRSQPNQDFVFATIEINGLTVDQKKVLARDFINKTVFQ